MYGELYRLDEAKTVQEFVRARGLTKLWLCPHLVSNGKIGNPSWMTGYECSNNSIPVEVRDKKVCKHFRESSTDCIIWFNDEDVSFWRRKE